MAETPADCPPLHYVSLAEEITFLRFLLQESELRDSGRINTQTITDDEILATLKRALWSLMQTHPTAFDDPTQEGSRDYNQVGQTISELAIGTEATLPIQSAWLFDLEKLTLKWINLRNSPEVRPYLFDPPTEAVPRPVTGDYGANNRSRRV